MKSSKQLIEIGLICLVLDLIIDGSTFTLMAPVNGLLEAAGRIYLVAFTQSVLTVGLLYAVVTEKQDRKWIVFSAGILVLNMLGIIGMYHLSPAGFLIDPLKIAWNLMIQTALISYLAFVIVAVGPQSSPLYNNGSAD